jgi:hypothetical protein
MAPNIKINESPGKTLKVDIKIKNEKNKIMNFSSWDWICAELVKTWSRQRKAKAAGLGKNAKNDAQRI